MDIYGLVYDNSQQFVNVLGNAKVKIVIQELQDKSPANLTRQIIIQGGLLIATISHGIVDWVTYGLQHTSYIKWLLTNFKSVRHFVPAAGIAIGVFQLGSCVQTYRNIKTFEEEYLSKNKKLEGYQDQVITIRIEVKQLGLELQSLKKQFKRLSKRQGKRNFETKVQKFNGKVDKFKDKITKLQGEVKEIMGGLKTEIQYISEIELCKKDEKTKGIAQSEKLSSYANWQALLNFIVAPDSNLSMANVPISIAQTYVLSCQKERMKKLNIKDITSIRTELQKVQSDIQNFHQTLEKMKNEVQSWKDQALEMLDDDSSSDEDKNEDEEDEIRDLSKIFRKDPNSQTDSEIIEEYKQNLKQKVEDMKISFSDYQALLENLKKNPGKVINNYRKLKQQAYYMMKQPGLNDFQLPEEYFQCQQAESLSQTTSASNSRELKLETDHSLTNGSIFQQDLSSNTNTLFMNQR